LPAETEPVDEPAAGLRLASSLEQGIPVAIQLRLIVAEHDDRDRVKVYAQTCLAAVSERLLQLGHVVLPRGVFACRRNPRGRDGRAGGSKTEIALEPITGRFAYVANNLSASISSYAVGNSGTVTLLNGTAASVPDRMIWR